MASHCQHCDKGKQYGHMVSHAKNRLRRIFLPNLQKLKVLKNGLAVSVVLCSGCIKRLKKDGRIGYFSQWKYSQVKVMAPSASVKEEVKEEIIKEEKTREKKVKEEKKKEALKIEDIVGKKS